jgi:hypothetical protein
VKSLRAVPVEKILVAAGQCGPRTLTSRAHSALPKAHYCPHAVNYQCEHAQQLYSTAVKHPAPPLALVLQAPLQASPLAPLLA